MKKECGAVIYSPSNLIRYLASPFASWLDRYYLENHGAITPDEETEEEKLLSRTGDEHEQSILSGYKTSKRGLVEIAKDDFEAAQTATLTAIKNKVPIIYQAALQDGVFAGFADFLILDGAGEYQVWDTKLALSPKPYYPIQLCCYSEMLTAMTGQGMPGRIGVILGNGDRVEFRVEDFIHYYCHIKNCFTAMHAAFSGEMDDCPEPLPRADHGRWTSHAEKLFLEKDHLVQVAGITVGQIKKLRLAGIATMTALSTAAGKSVHKLDNGTLDKLILQARLQCETRDERKANPEAKPRYEVLSYKGPNGEPVGLATLPPADPADVFFDMEGYPLIPGGLEYLFGDIQDVEKAEGVSFSSDSLDSNLSAFLDSPRFPWHANTVRRYLAVLNWFIETVPNGRNHVLNYRREGASRRFFATSPQELTEHASSPNPHQIGRSGVWALTTTDSRLKREIVDDFLRIIKICLPVREKVMAAMR
jgi:uncharacterized protein